MKGQIENILELRVERDQNRSQNEQQRKQR